MYQLGLGNLQVQRKWLCPSIPVLSKLKQKIISVYVIIYIRLTPLLMSYILHFPNDFWNLGVFHHGQHSMYLLAFDWVVQ